MPRDAHFFATHALQRSVSLDDDNQRQPWRPFHFMTRSN